MKTQLFPYSLVRYAALPNHRFDQLKLSQAEKLIADYQTGYEEKEKLKTAFCDALFPVITNQTDDKIRQQLINIKRKIFNGKRTTEKEIDLLHIVIPEPLVDYLHKYLFKVAELAVFLKESNILFNHEQEEHRRLIQQMALMTGLQNGLLLSSPVLYGQLSDFVKKDVTKFKQKELRMEFSLLRYLTRMAFKTSPFSSFTYTGLMLSAVPNLVENSFKVHEVGSRLKLNNMLFEYLRAVIRQHPVLNEYLYVKLNITAEIKADKIHFLTNFNNIEAFQQLKAGGLPLLVLQFLKDTGQSVSLKNLITHLSTRIAASCETIKLHLMKLMDTGMFELGLGVSGMHQYWDQKLLTFFKDNANAEKAFFSLIELFETLEIYRGSYVTANPVERYRILQDAEKMVNAVFLELQKEAGLPYYTTVDEKKTINVVPEKEDKIFLTNNFVPYYFSARNIFYEDCFTTEPEILSEAEINDFVFKTNQLATHLIPLDVMLSERLKMRDFFLRYYPKGQKIALTAFYNDYYFHVKKPEKEGAESGGQRVLNSTWKAAVLTKLTQQGLVGETLNFSADFFCDLPKGEIETLNASLGTFVQFYHSADQNKQYGVVNGLLPGMGKVSGRFLSLFDQKVTNAFVSHNEALHPQVIKTELNDASTFNANVHPALLKHELALPSGNNIYAEDEQIKIGDLSVGFDEKANTLKLCLADKQVYSYDLSLESFYNRSNLYQLLAHFNPDARISLQPFIQLVDEYCQNSLATPEPDFFVLPRISYAETVIIRRKTWRIKTSFVPFQNQEETDFEYFIRLNIWLETNEIPTEIFLFLRKKAYQLKTVEGTVEKKEGLHDDYKPQYISFHQPLLVGMFKRLLARAGKYIIIEEMLPVSGTGQVKEYLIQWYNS